MKELRMNKGFTLIEVLIAIIVFSIALLALVPLLVTSVNIDTDDMLKARAQRLVISKMDELLSVDSSGLSNGNDAIVENGITLNRVWTVVPATGNLNTITVTVSYTYKGQTKTFTAVSERGV